MGQGVLRSERFAGRGDAVFGENASVLNAKSKINVFKQTASERLLNT